MASINTGLGGPQGVGENSFHGSSLTAGNIDDGSIYVDVTSVFGPGGFEFFGDTFTGIYINTNGNITLNGPNTAYTPTAVEDYSQPIIAPFWSDVNIRSGSATGTNNIYWDLDPVGGNVTITWLGVNAYSAAGQNTFQVVLSDNGDGDVGIEFIYEDIQWTNGYTGSATAGISDGGSNDYVLPGSQDDTALADYDTATLSDDDPDGTWDLNLTDGTPPCFARNTLIETDRGAVAVEWLRAGDMVRVLDGRFAPVLWVGSTTLGVTDETAPVRLPPGILDNQGALMVSPQHRVLVESAGAEFLFGAPAVFVRAMDFVSAGLATRDHTRSKIEYFHVLLPEHAAIISNGQASESFFPGAQGLASLPKRHRETIAALETKPDDRLAYPELKRHEARVLLGQVFAQTPHRCHAA
jgi:hypothetical protein